MRMGSDAEHYDVIVVGGGLGGLATGLLLSDRGDRVLLLEAHTMVGGCAGAFDRFERVGKGAGRTFRRFRFDVGATTLSGLHPGGPFDRLFRQIGDRPSLRRVDPGIISHLSDGSLLHRYADLDRWIAEASRVFGAEGQEGFWREVARVAERCWNLAMNNLRFPPSSAADYLALLRPKNLAALPILPKLGSSIGDLLARHGLDHHEAFGRFIDEQLMITAQNRAEETPLTVGAMGLHYPSDTWYVEGGMVALAAWMAGKIGERGGDVRTKHRVRSIARSGDAWQVSSVRGDFSADRLVANLTMWDLQKLLEERSDLLQDRIDRLPATWGALYWTGAIPDVIDDRGSLYHQIAVDPLPFAGSGSIFLSLSPPDDDRRAPEGYRTLAVSTHVGDPGEWIRLRQEEPEEYRRRKGLYAAQVRRRLSETIPGFAGAPIRYEEVATPSSFQFFTHRHNGSVGGVPFSRSRGLFTLPDHHTGCDRLAIVGDTVYPGQGAPAVVLGGMRVVGSS